MLAAVNGEELLHVRAFVVITMTPALPKATVACRGCSRSMAALLFSCH
jgi:hypothetical protein